MLRFALRTLVCNDTRGLTFWLDGRLLPPAELLGQPLSAGEHIVTIAVDTAARQQTPLRIEGEN